MKNIVAALAAALALTASASAADLEPYSTTAYTVDDVHSDWTGFYVGTLAGYGWGDQDHDVEFFGKDTSDVNDFLSHEPEGWLFGGTVGVNYQPAGTQVVVGIEADWSYADHEDGNVGFGPYEEVYSKTEIESLGTARVRAGYLVNRDLLLYATGGIAWASVKSTVGLADVNIDKDYSAELTEQDTNVGWTVGTGLERKLDDVWSIKVDYLYVDLADTEHSLSGPSGTASITDDLTEHMVRVGVNAKLF